MVPSVVYFTYIFGSIEIGLQVRSIELDSFKIHSFSLKLLSFQLLPKILPKARRFKKYRIWESREYFYFL